MQRLLTGCTEGPTTRGYCNISSPKLVLHPGDVSFQGRNPRRLDTLPGGRGTGAGMVRWGLEDPAAERFVGLRAPGLGDGRCAGRGGEAGGVMGEDVPLGLHGDLPSTHSLMGWVPGGGGGGVGAMAAWAMMDTASTGYLPVADSPESMTA